MAPAESRHTASRAPEPLRDDPFAELSPGTVSAAPLLHPQRQRELIEQAAGMSRQVAGLLAAAAPEVLPPRDTLRAVAPALHLEGEHRPGVRTGTAPAEGSHVVDPRMSWGDLVARVVREAVTRHDPRGGGRGQRRKGAGSAGASPRRAPKETRAAGAEVGPAQRVGESSPRAPNAAGAAAEPAQRGHPRRGRNRCRRGAGGPGSAQRRRYFGARRRRYRGRIRSRCWPTAPPRQSAPAALLDGARDPLLRRVGARGCRPHNGCYFGAAVHPRHCWMAPALAALHRARPRSASSRPAPWRIAPMPAAVPGSSVAIGAEAGTRRQVAGACWPAAGFAAPQVLATAAPERRATHCAPWRPTEPVTP